MPPKDFLLCKEYFLREKELANEEKVKNKLKWKGSAFLGNDYKSIDIINIV